MRYMIYITKIRNMILKDIIKLVLFNTYLQISLTNRAAFPPNPEKCRVC